MANDLKRRLRNLEGGAGSAVTGSAGGIRAAVGRCSSEHHTPGCPDADAFGAMLRSMRPATATLFLHAQPADLML